jgi:hypothetical protein
MFINNIVKVLALQQDRCGEGASDSDSSRVEDDQTISMKQHPVYLWAGYLPAGKQTILIYDKFNRQILQKEILIEQGPLDPETGMPSDKSFPFWPSPVPQQEIEELDEEYADTVNVEQVRESETALKKSEQDAIDRKHAVEMAKFNKSKKKGKKKK